MGDRELSYCELRAKEVVNATDGKRMGRIVDILFSRDDGMVCGIVVPLSRRNVFAKNQDLYIPWNCVQKIGEDVILVQLSMDMDGRMCCNKNEPTPKPHGCSSHERDQCSHGHGGSPHGRDQCSQECGCMPDGASPNHPHCDNRCEKCMLFDCAYRWQGM